MDRLEHNNIVKEIEDSFLDYSMSVITSRAIPDLRDGLKPVHRRILYSMYESGYTPDKPHRKSDLQFHNTQMQCDGIHKKMA